MDRIGTLIICSAGRHQDVISLSRMKAGNADAGVSTVRSAAGVVVIAADDLERVTRRLFVSGIQYLEHLNERVLIVEVAAGAGMDACGFVRGGEGVPDGAGASPVQPQVVTAEPGIAKIGGGVSVVGKRGAAATVRSRQTDVLSIVIRQFNLEGTFAGGPIPAFVVVGRKVTRLGIEGFLDTKIIPRDVTAERIVPTDRAATLQVRAADARAAEPGGRAVAGGRTIRVILTLIQGFPEEAVADRVIAAKVGTVKVVNIAEVTRIPTGAFGRADVWIIQFAGLFRGTGRAAGLRVAFDVRKIRLIVAFMYPAGPGPRAILVGRTWNQRIVGFAMGQTLVSSQVGAFPRWKTTPLRPAGRVKEAISTGGFYTPAAFKASDHRRVIEAQRVCIGIIGLLSGTAGARRWFATAVDRGVDNTWCAVRRRERVPRRLGRAPIVYEKLR